MNKELIEQQLESLAKEARENEQLAVAGIIYALLGAMKANNEIGLYLHIRKFSENEIKRLSASRN
jgi:hypothetical protein